MTWGKVSSITVRNWINLTRQIKWNRLVLGYNAVLPPSAFYETESSWPSFVKSMNSRAFGGFTLLLCFATKTSFLIFYFSIYSFIRATNNLSCENKCIAVELMSHFEWGLFLKWIFASFLRTQLFQIASFFSHSS